MELATAGSIDDDRIVAGNRVIIADSPALQERGEQ